jgi:hypothetical protein
MTIDAEPLEPDGEHPALGAERSSYSAAEALHVLAKGTLLVVPGLFSFLESRNSIESMSPEICQAGNTFLAFSSAERGLQEWTVPFSSLTRTFLLLFFSVGAAAKDLTAQHMFRGERFLPATDLILAATWEQKLLFVESDEVPDSRS